MASSDSGERGKREEPGRWPGFFLWEPDKTGAFGSIRREFLPRRLGFTHKRMTKIDANASHARGS